MSKTSEKQYMCPIFPDMPCPRGKDGSEKCKVRMQADFDPMTDLKDYAMMHCALLRSQQQEGNNDDQPLV